ncbi:cyclic nucleotide-binding protein [Bacteroidia bacterium]|nr:cyclic nucleotide-binding protein [Bacteroidia bacterium]
MNNERVKFLSKNTPLSTEIIHPIVETAIIKNFEKGTILKNSECCLILKGCVRCYLVKDGEEKTIEFYTEGQPVSFSIGAGDGTSEYFWECTEDTMVCIGTSEKESEMFVGFPEFESACRIMAEKLMINYQTEFANYKLASAEERYLKLLKERPDLIQRVPQYQLASYLGVMPETLSRIRRRLSKK